jgi:peptidoglycan/xylan/chitin deacetylase (PgdA/CDA1 family)
MPSHLMTVDLDHLIDHSAESARASELFVDTVLATVDATGANATFFIPRQVATVAPALLRRIVESGNEVGCLTTTHLGGRPPYSAEFRRELIYARREIEDAMGRRLKGHRAARFGISTSSEWAYDVLIDEGFEYDSSRMPQRAEYGVQGVPPNPHAVRRWSGTILEIPSTTSQLFALQVQLVATPAFRRLPAMFSRRAITQRERRGDPAMIHLRQSDITTASEQTSRETQRVLRRVGGLLGRFQFTSVERALASLSGFAEVVES